MCKIFTSSITNWYYFGRSPYKSYTKPPKTSFMKLPKRSWMKLTKRYLKGPYMKLPKRFCMKLTKWSYIKLPKRAYMKLPKATFACLKYFSCNKIEHFVVFRWISKNCKECSILSTDHCLCLLICTLLTLYGAMTLVGTTRSIHPPPDFTLSRQHF